jgi:putative transposase
VARFEIPDGMTVQAFQFALDLTAEQAACVRRQFGARRYAHNWTVRTLKNDLAAYHATGAESPVPSMIGLRKRWNQAKDRECVDRDTGEIWWPAVSKEAFADGIAGAVDAYWNWQQSRAGDRDGRRIGFPRFKKKGRDRDRGHVHDRRDPYRTGPPSRHAPQDRHRPGP